MSLQQLQPVRAQDKGRWKIIDSVWVWDQEEEYNKQMRSLSQTDNQCCLHAPIHSFIKYYCFLLLPCFRIDRDACFCQISIFKLHLLFAHYFPRTCRPDGSVVSPGSVWPLLAACREVWKKNNCKTPDHKTASHVVWTGEWSASLELM